MITKTKPHVDNQRAAQEKAVKLKTVLPASFFVWIQMPLYFLYSQEQFEYITIIIGFPTNLAIILSWWSIFPLLDADPIFHVVTWIAPLIQLYILGLILDWIISKVKKARKHDLNPKHSGG